MSRDNYLCSENCAKVLKTKYRIQKFFVICVTDLTPELHFGLELKITNYQIEGALASYENV